MFGEMLKSIRTEKGITQQNLSEKIHVTRQTISRWEKDLSSPSGDDLLALSSALDVDITIFFGLNDTKTFDKHIESQQLADLCAEINHQFVTHQRKRYIQQWLLIVGNIAVFIGFTLYAFIYYKLYIQSLYSGDILERINLMRTAATIISLSIIFWMALHIIAVIIYKDTLRLTSILKIVLYFLIILVFMVSAVGLFCLSSHVSFGEFLQPLVELSASVIIGCVFTLIFRLLFNIKSNQ